MILQDPTSRTNEELPRRRLKSVGAVGWSADGPLPPIAPNLGNWAVLVSLVLIPWVMACPKKVCFGTWASFCLSLILMLWLVAHFALICGVWFLAHEVCFLP